MSEKPSDWAVAPKFGEWLRGIYASERNPYRDGIYVRTIRRTGRCNPGTYFELTDGNGNFWQYPRDSVIRLDRARELDASGGGAKPTAWQSRSRYWDGAPWSAWQTFNSAEERAADWAPYIGSEWQCQTRELYATPRAAEAGDTERLDWIMRNVRGSELRRIGVHTSGGESRPAIDAARSGGGG
jgi:hypothetical protein